MGLELRREISVELGALHIHHQHKDGTYRKGMNDITQGDCDVRRVKSYIGGFALNSERQLLKEWHRKINVQDKHRNSWRGRRETMCVQYLKA